MAASLMTFTGHPNASRKLKFIQPPPRLCGSRRGCPLITGPGYPNDTRLKIQSLAQFLTSRTILLAVIDGPEARVREYSPFRSQVFLRFQQPRQVDSQR